jgi:hypothetical protein
VGEFVSQQLGKPEFAHFLRASHPGGGTASGQPAQTGATAPANPTPAPQPRTMGEAVILHMATLAKNEVPGQQALSRDAEGKLVKMPGFGLRAPAKAAQ